MRIVNWTVEWPSRANTNASGQIEVEDSATDDEISAMVLDEIQNHVTWGWEAEDAPALTVKHGTDGAA